MLTLAMPVVYEIVRGSVCLAILCVRVTFTYGLERDAKREGYGVTEVYRGG
jgi:hypothetical protein